MPNKNDDWTRSGDAHKSVDEKQLDLLQAININLQTLVEQMSALISETKNGNLSNFVMIQKIHDEVKAFREQEMMG